MLLMSPTCAHAASDWLCTEEAAQRRGDTIIVCGIGLGSTEAQARDDATEKAKAEFGSICEQSSDCRGHETIVSPMRNTCDPTNDGWFRCYRGFEYQITDQLKPKPLVQSGSSEAGQQSDMTGLPWRLQVGFGYAGDSESGLNKAPGYFCCGTFDATLQRKAFWRFYLALRYSYRAGHAGTPQSETGANGQGSPNTSANFVSSSTSNEGAVSVPVEIFNGWFLVPEIGRTVGTISYSQQSYNSDGQGTWTGTGGTSSFQNNFFGGQIKYESSLARLKKLNCGLYVDVGLRDYLSGGSTVVNAGIGMLFGF